MTTRRLPSLRSMLLVTETVTDEHKVTCPRCKHSFSPDQEVNWREVNKRDLRKSDSVNGIEISLAFDDGYGDYTVYVVDADPTHAVTRISEDPDEAERAYNAILRLASKAKGPDDLVRMMDAGMYKR